MSAFTKNIYSFSLDIKRKTGTRVLSVEGDTANQFIVFLTDDGKPIDLTGLYVRAVFRRSDGHTVLQSESDEVGPVTKVAGSGKVTIPVKNSAYRDGDNYMEIQILDGDPDSGDVLSTTAQMLIRARNCLLTDDATIGSVEFPVLQSLIDALRNMEVHVETLPSTSDATGHLELEDGIFVLYLGIPRGIGIANITLSGGYLTFTLDDDTEFEFYIGSTVFIATYGETTGAEIVTAHNNGMMVICQRAADDPRYGLLHSYYDGGGVGAAIFYGIDRNSIVRYTVTGDVWDSVVLMTGTFIATYGVTTYEEIYNAYVNDMAVYCAAFETLYPLVHARITDAHNGLLSFFAIEGASVVGLLCMGTGAPPASWSSDVFHLQQALTAGNGISLVDNGEDEDDGVTTHLGYTISATPMVGATSSANGVAGMVPAPLIADREKYLRGDGTWQEVQGGGADGAVFIAEYGVTEYAEIEDAIEAGKAIWVHWTTPGDQYATLTWSGQLSFFFTHQRAAGIESVACYNMMGTTLWSKAIQYSQNKLQAGNGITLTDPTPVTEDDTQTIGNTIISADAMVGATASANGSAGMVPAPLIADREKYLRGDGTWATPSGGGSASDAVFVAEYDVTSFDAITAAITAGKAVFVHWTASSKDYYAGYAYQDDEVQFIHEKTTTGRVETTRITCYDHDGDTTWEKQVNCSQNWLAAGTGIEIASPTSSTSGDDTTLIGTSEISAKAMVGATSQANGSAGIVPAPLVADREKYLRGDGTWQAVQGGSNDVFVAIYGTTSYADIKAASDAGKAVFAFRAADGVAAPLTNIHITSSTSDLSFEYTHNWTIHKYLCFYGNNSTTWSNSSTMLMRKGFGHGVCSTAAATAAKTVSIDDYVACDGAIIAVRFTYGVPASATLSVNNAAASAIYHNGAAIGANIINAGDTATLMYKATGGIFHLIAIDRNAQDKPTEVTVSTAGAVSQACEDNTIYTFTGALTSLTLTEASGAREYIVIFTTGSTAPTVTPPTGVIFPDGTNTFTAKANTRYEISVRDGFALVGSWEASV